MGDFEVLAEELEGEAEEGLVLGGNLSLSWEGGDNGLTRMRCVSGFSLEVMWSAILLWLWEGACGKEVVVGLGGE